MKLSKGCGKIARYDDHDFFECGKDYGNPFGILLCDECSPKTLNGAIPKAGSAKQKLLKRSSTDSVSTKQGCRH